jgi:DNA invertase Pin-like site-specific DNA recombinase
VAEFYDAAVSGADHVDTRPGFAAMLERIEGNGVRTIIVETANRFARDLLVQEVGYERLRERGIDLIAADSPTSFLDDGPTSKLVRQVLGAIAEFDKAMTVAKLRGARDRIRKERGKGEGRKSLAEVKPEAVALAKKLRRASPKKDAALSAILDRPQRPGAAIAVSGPCSRWPGSISRRRSRWLK